ncbi:MAG: hypothetical protein ACT6FF_09735, partial [Methanosarcinaceae archaeon]
LSSSLTGSLYLFVFISWVVSIRWKFFFISGLSGLGKSSVKAVKKIEPRIDTDKTRIKQKTIKRTIFIVVTLVNEMMINL